MYGRGSILRVDLTNERITTEAITEQYQKYLGGEGINARLLWEHFLRIDPKIDPASPDSIFIAGIGPLGATGLGLGSKTQWTFKSPVTNMYGSASSGGFFGSHLRWSGYDHLVITGRAKHPVYLWINNDNVEIRDANHIWGKTIEETDDMIKKELGNPYLDIAGIGQAGENLVKFASIMAYKERAAGRCGGGCVLGSKNLKALAAYGTRGISVSDSKGFLRVAKKISDSLYRKQEPYITWRKQGTFAIVKPFSELGYLPWRNSRGYQVPSEVIARMDDSWYDENLLVSRLVPCSPGCAVACGGWCLIKGNETESAARYAGEWGTRPEYGNWASVAGGCGIDDLPTMIHLVNKCNKYGMDTFEVGMQIAFLMELWERGIIDNEEVADWLGEPASLNWGNVDTVERIIDTIALQDSKMGNILQGGVYQAAIKIGELKRMPLLKYACYGKGGATHEQTVKGWPDMAIAVAVCPIGAHHTKGLGVSRTTAQLFLNDPKAAEQFELTLKGAAHAVSENLAAVANSLGICWFLSGTRPWNPSIIPLEIIADALYAVTGVETTSADLYTGGKRLANLAKAFNSRLGFLREDDTLCERWLREPQLEGLTKGWKAEDYIEQLKDEYYEYHGWDKKTSLPTRGTLEELGMDDVAEVLAREKALPQEHN